ncbi:sphingosine kinase 1 [Aplysia californica]|uniref:Sphingosine kinase 1 n=1 Tax=Aplysia californica TaxID=6500 RepID=A0ABM0JQL3_APLCA|nr:sphingosine kinase 1 [Aplysia californica]
METEGAVGSIDAEEGKGASATASDDSGDVILSGSVQAGKKSLLLALTTNGVTVHEVQAGEKVKDSSLNLDLPWCEVITAETSGEGGKSKFSIHFMQYQKDRKLRHKSLTLTSQDIEPRKWADAIQTQCQQVSGRPKNLFVIINPIGGNGKGSQMYHKSVAPMFKLAGCQTTVVETEKSKHALEIGETRDFTGFDGIISVGGDGLYQEILQGYLVQLQKAAGVNLNDIDEEFVKPKIPFCLIPAGSSNGIVRYTNDNVRDAETSALRVIRGETHPTSIITIHEPGKFIGISGLAVGVGAMTDFMKRCDELRWMGKSRYGYGMLRMFVKKKRRFRMQMEYLLDGEPSPIVKTEGAQGDTESLEIKTGWHQHDIDDKPYVGATLSTFSVKDMPECTVIDPFSCSGDLMVDTGCSNMGIIKYALMFEGKKINGPIPNIEFIKGAVGVRFKVIQDPSETDENVSQARAREREMEHYLYVDGEVVQMEGLEVEARLKNDFVSMFGCIASQLRTPQNAS